MFPYLKKFLRHLVLRKASQQSIVDWKHGNKWKTSPQPSNQRQSKPDFFQSQSQREPNMFVTLVKSTTLYSWLIKSIYWKLVFIALFTTSDKLTILTVFWQFEVWVLRTMIEWFERKRTSSMLVTLKTSSSILWVKNHFTVWIDWM